MIENPAVRVPAEHRFLGLDRRTFPFAVVALAVWAFWVALVPWIDDQVAWNDRVEAGDVMVVTPDVTFTPAVGWEVTSGIRVSDHSVTGDQSPPDVVLTDGSVTLLMRAGPWQGSASELLRQITAITTTTDGGDAFRVTSRPGSVTTGQGVVGAAESFTSPRVTGLLAAFVFGGDGVEVQVAGPLGQVSRRSAEITGMIESLTQAGGGVVTATAAGATEEAERRSAIEQSGWGARFVFRQPHNACWWVYLALVASGLWNTWRLMAGTVPAYGDAYTAALLGAAAFTAVFVLFLRWADRWERTPATLAVAAFVFGGFAATYAIALPANAAMMSLYAKIFGQAWAEDWKAGLTAPFVEETAKGIGFLLLLGLAPVVIRTLADGLIVGAYVGLGFQVLEDVLYGSNAAAEHFGADQVGSVLSTYALRMTTGISSHALYTALFSAGLVYLIGTVAQPRRAGRGLLLILAAMVLHGVWDSAAALGGGTAGSLLILGLTIVVSLTLLVVAFRWAGRSERAYMSAILRPEVGGGVLTEAEFAAATGYRRQRRAALRQRRRGTSRRAEKHVVRAARDLGHDLAVAGGETSAAVAHSRAEITRLRGAAAVPPSPGP